MVDCFWKADVILIVFEVEEVAKEDGEESEVRKSEG